MRFSILVPDATINYITNPSLRYDTTGWVAQDATITRSLEQARFGIASLKAVTSGVSNNEGCSFRVSALSGISEAVTVSAYVRGGGVVRIRLDDNSVGGGEYTSQPFFLDPSRWNRIHVTGFSTGGNDLRLYVETAEGTPKARTFYVDGAQLERKPYPTTYCDGDQPDCRWSGMFHASTSSRDGSTRAGGRWVQLAGEQREAEGLYMTVLGGLGFAPLANHVEMFAKEPGGFFENVVTTERVISLTFHAMHRVAGREDPLSLSDLHSLREMLIETIDPENEGQDIWFEYLDGDLPLYFQARYEGGLEGDWDARNPFLNSFPLRLFSVSPLLYDDDQQVQVLDFQDSFTAPRVLGRIDGAWNRMNGGMNGSVGDLEFGARGELVAAGVFSLVNVRSDAIPPTFETSWHVSYWDGEKWNRLVTFMDGTTVNDVAIATNGDIYITGDLSVVDGVAANNIARWNGSAWSALGSGLNNHGIHISIDASGRVYVGGRFTTAGGVAANGIAFWDGSSWHGMGQYSGFDARVNSIAVTPDGSRVYVGGWFVFENGVPAVPFLRVAVYDPVTDRFSTLGAGFNGDVREVILDAGGTLYACGDFTLSGTTTVNRIARFDGNTWVPLGDGMNNNVLSFDVGRNGDIIAVGDFSQAGDANVRNLALWNGSTWTSLDIDIAVGDTALTLLAVQYNPNGDVYIAGFWGNTSQHLFSAINLVDNPGTASSDPILYVQGPGKLRWLENQTTKKRIFFDLDVQVNEELVIDFGRGELRSSLRGLLLNEILPGSDMHAFRLVPGPNRIACLMTNDVGAQVQLRYTPTYWGADAVLQPI